MPSRVVRLRVDCIRAVGLLRGVPAEAPRRHGVRRKQDATHIQLDFGHADVIRGVYIHRDDPGNGPPVGDAIATVGGAVSTVVVPFDTVMFT